MARKVESCQQPKACTPPPAFSSDRLSAQEACGTYSRVHAQRERGNTPDHAVLYGTPPPPTSMGRFLYSIRRIQLISASERTSIIKTTHRIGSDEERCVCPLVGVAQREVYDALLCQRERLQTNKIAVRNYFISDKIRFASP